MSLEAAERLNETAGHLLELYDAAHARWRETGELADAQEAVDYAAAAERLVTDAGLEAKT